MARLSSNQVQWLKETFGERMTTRWCSPPPDAGLHGRAGSGTDAHMIGDGVPLVTQPMIDYLEGKRA